jgi:hydroxymethylbilane synthase
MSEVVRIGTRDSELAMWQARFVEERLNERSVRTEIVPIKSDGELDLTTPLYEIGVEGIFTKALDAALLSGRIDVAVHSLKDVPTRLAKGLSLVGVPERGSWVDVLVQKKAGVDPSQDGFVLATSSLRRQAQWLNRYPGSVVVPMRGNIQTRLRKLVETDAWKGALFAAAGIDRVGLEVPHRTDMDWMVPAPSQGALAIVARSDDASWQSRREWLDHRPTRWCVEAERSFLRRLMGGCSMPIGALATIADGKMHFRGNILTTDGLEKAEVEMWFDEEDFAVAGERAAEEILRQGGAEILKKLRPNA